MGRREQIRGRLEAAEDARPGRWEVRGGFPSNVYVAGNRRIEGFVAYAPHAADLIANAPSDLRDLLAVADEMESVDAIAQWRMVGSLPPADLKLAHAMEKNIRAALDRLDNGGDR